MKKVNNKVSSKNTDNFQETILNFLSKHIVTWYILIQN